MSNSQYRTDLTQSQEDFARVMEDYFRIIPPFLDFFDLNKIKKWHYDDFDNTITFYFDNKDDLMELNSELFGSMNRGISFVYDEPVDLDEINFSVRIKGIDGGLL